MYMFHVIKLLNIWLHIKQQVRKELSMDFICLFEIIYAIPYIIIRVAKKCSGTKIIIHDIKFNFVT